MKKAVQVKLSETAPMDHLIPSTAKNAELVALKHQIIVDGALKVLFTKGDHLTTIREIARACGMSMGQLYHYISSKDDILYLVHKHMHELWINHLINLAVDDIKDPELRLK